MNKKLIVIHPFTSLCPGRYLQDALKSIGYSISLFNQEVDFKKVDQSGYDAILFIENSFASYEVAVHNIDQAHLPKFYWVYHGESRLDYNLKKCQDYRINCVLLATSLHLADKYRIPFKELPLAADPRFFPNKRPFAKRKYDLSFVGSAIPVFFYHERNKLLELIKEKFPKLKLYISHERNLDKMGEVYGNSKIIFNWNYKSYLSQRLFEGMASGALMLTNPAHHIEILGQHRKHYVIYHSPEDLISKIDYYRKNLAIAEQIAVKGCQKVLAHHTYLHRAKKLERIIAEYLKEGGPHP